MTGGHGLEVNLMNNPPAVRGLRGGVVLLWCLIFDCFCSCTKAYRWWREGNIERELWNYSVLVVGKVKS